MVKKNSRDHKCNNPDWVNTWKIKIKGESSSTIPSIQKDFPVRFICVYDTRLSSASRGLSVGLRDSIK